MSNEIIQILVCDDVIIKMVMPSVGDDTHRID